MKKIIAVFLLVALLCLSACTNNQPLPNETETNESTTSVTANKALLTEKDVGGGMITVQKYRHRFYSVPEPFISLVDRNAYFEWEETIDITTTAEKMVMSQFVQHFGITREQFDKANLKWAKIVKDKLFGVPCINPKDYANQEDDEIYNADIIFTFDDNLIREYYLSPDYPFFYDVEFEEAVANGEYTSQTEDWVDIEQMEAEIIAKYGEAEIITEAAEDVTTESTVESSETETPSEALKDTDE